MKVRSGFVSNSSSTAFMFVTRDDDFKNLRNLIVAHEEKRFDNLVCDWADCCNCSFDVLDVVKTIEDHWNGEMYKPIEEVLEEAYSILKMYDDLIKKKGDIEKTWSRDWYQESRNEYSQICATLERAVEQGFKFVFTIDFGNDGEVAGYLGDAVRSEADRSISVHKDLVVYNEDRS